MPLESKYVLPDPNSLLNAVKINQQSSLSSLHRDRTDELFIELSNKIQQFLINK